MADLTSEARGAVEAFNNADWDGVRKYFADSTYTEFGTQRSVSGFDALLELMQGWKAAMPDVRGTVTGAAEEGQRVVLEIMWEGTQTGELVTEQGTIPASGNRQRTPAAWVFDYEGGQLREKPALLRHAHLPPADRSRAITAGRRSRPVSRVLSPRFP